MSRVSLFRRSRAKPEQQQSAGTGSQQLQASRDIVNHYGVSAADVLTITQAEIGRVRGELTELASRAESVVQERLQAFQDRVVDQFAENESLRAAFADPDFQFSLQDAGRAAVSNDDQHTEDLLLDLLTNRAEQTTDARVRLATSHAIRAADKLSLDALRGLTALWAVASLSPGEPGALEVLSQAQGVAEQLITVGLPLEPSWIDEADALNLARLLTMQSRNPYRAFLSSRAAGHLNPGINAAECGPLLTSATATCPWLAGILRPHPLKPGFMILPGTHRDDFVAPAPVGADFTPELEQLITMNGYGQQDNTASARFVGLLNESAARTTLADWWDAVPACNLTLVGQTIGFVNARRFLTWTGAQTVAEMLHSVRR